MRLCFRGTRAADANNYESRACSARERTAGSTAKSIRFGTAHAVKRAACDSRTAPSAFLRSIVLKPNRIAAFARNQQGHKNHARQVGYRRCWHHKCGCAPDNR